MDVVLRNFFRLMRCGALADDQPLEPMSVFKWGKAVRLVRDNAVAPVAAKAIERYAGAVPDAARRAVDGLTAMPEANAVIEVPEVTLSNIVLKRRLTAIRAEEGNAGESGEHTLVLLNLIIHNMNLMLNHGIGLNMMLCLAKYLRAHASDIDAPKLVGWLAKLHIRKIVQIEADMLVDFLGFGTDEVPFYGKPLELSGKIVERSLACTPPLSADEMGFGQNRAGFLHGNTHAVGRNVSRAIRYMRYAPIESVSNLMRNFAISLSEIEE